MNTLEYNQPKDQEEKNKFLYNIPIKWQGIYQDTRYIDNYFNNLFGNNSEKVTQFQELMASIIIRKPKSRMVFFVGNGNNGKTTLLKFIKELLGDYMIFCPLKSLKYTKEIAETMILCFNDFSDENYFKENKDLIFLTNNYVLVEHPNNEAFEGQITHTLFYQSNKIPHLSDYYKNHSMIIELNEKFNGNPNFFDELVQHKEELLVWIVKGLL